MYAMLRVALVFCVVLSVASCSETEYNNEAETDTDLLFAPLEHDDQFDENLLGFWSTCCWANPSNAGFFMFNEEEWFVNAGIMRVELLIIEFQRDNKWTASLLLKDLNDEYQLLYPYLTGEYMFKDNHQFMMSGGRFGCFSVVTGLYAFRPHGWLVLRANGSSIGLERYNPLRDPRVKRGAEPLPE